MARINNLIAANHDYVVAMRRHFRMYPELSGEEHSTQQKIVEELTALGLTPRPIGGTGVLAEICGAAGDKTVAIRADMDALPVQDEIDRDYRSRHCGVSHACGHDGHSAMLLGVARTLCQSDRTWPGTVRLLFQPSEERLPGGARLLVDEGALDGVSAIFGAHLWQPLAVGTIGIHYGPAMASCNEFRIAVHGRGGHGSMPHQTVDPILLGAQLVVALKSLIGTRIDARETAVLSIGAFNAGAVFNVIPDNACLLGTVRVFKMSVLDDIFAQIDTLCRGLCQAAGAGYTFEPIVGYPPVINDPAAAALVAAAAREVVGDVVEMQPTMGSEDFSHYQQRVPGAYFFIGIGNDAKGARFPHHHAKFDMDEDALRYGCEVMVNAALKALTK
jgi:amidohydrolase